jgi:hypothetical protein
MEGGVKSATVISVVMAVAVLVLKVTNRQDFTTHIPLLSTEMVVQGRITA